MKKIIVNIPNLNKVKRVNLSQFKPAVGLANVKPVGTPIVETTPIPVFKRPKIKRAVTPVVHTPTIRVTHITVLSNTPWF